MNFHKLVFRLADPMNIVAYKKQHYINWDAFKLIVYFGPLQKEAILRRKTYFAER